MTKFEIARSFNHRTFGAVGSVALAAEVGEVKLGGKRLPDASVEYLLNFALQSLQDAYAGAKNADEAKASWEKKLAAIVEGTLGQRASSGVSVETSVARQITRAALKAMWGAKSPKWAEFTGLADDVQAAKLDEVFEKNEAKLAPQVKTELKRRADAKKATDGLALDVEI